MVQTTPFDPEETYTCDYCGFSAFELEGDGVVYVLDYLPHHFFCSYDCAEDYETDCPNED